MASFKFNEAAKQVFIDCYNNPDIPAISLHKEINRILHEKGYLEPNIEFNAEVVRQAIEGKLGLTYRNRPRKKVSLEIDFESTETIDVDESDPIPILEGSNWEDEETVQEEEQENYSNHPKEPVNFNY